MSLYVRKNNQRTGCSSRLTVGRFTSRGDKELEIVKFMPKWLIWLWINGWKFVTEKDYKVLHINDQRPRIENRTRFIIPPHFFHS